MWAAKRFSSIRDAVADGVKEFSTGALTEVQQGITETKAAVKDVAQEVSSARSKAAQSRPRARGQSPKGTASQTKLTEKKLSATKSRDGKPGKAGLAAGSAEEQLPSPPGSRAPLPLPSVSAIQSMRQESLSEELSSEIISPGSSGRSDDYSQATLQVPDAGSDKAPEDPYNDDFGSSSSAPALHHPQRAGSFTATTVSKAADDRAYGKGEEDEDDDEDWGLHSSRAASPKGNTAAPLPLAPAPSPAADAPPRAAAPGSQPADLSKALAASEQKARNAESRLKEASQSSAREKQRWADERAQLTKQVEDLQAKIVSGAKEREQLESSVNTLASQLESRLSALSGNVEARDAEVTQLREENESMNSAFEEMRIILKKSVDERSRINEEMLSLERQLARTRKELSDSQAAHESTKRKHMEAMMALAEAKANSERGQGQTVSEDEHQAVEARVQNLLAELEEAKRQLALASEAAEKSEETAREATTARLEAERLRREAQAEMQSAMCAAEAERIQRAEAQGQSEQLKSESERRARVFNNAVKAAVQKIQRELEEENASLQDRVREAESAAAAAAQKAADAEAAEAEAYREAAARSVDAEAAGNLAVQAQEAADRSRAREQEAQRVCEDATARCHHAERAKEQLQTQLAAAEAQTKAAEAEGARLLAEVKEIQDTTSARISALEAEASLLRERAKAAAEGAAATSARAVALEREADEKRQSCESEAESSKKELASLRAELEELRNAKVARPAFTFPTGQEVLQQLGLDKLREERLEYKDKGPPKAPDIEVGSKKRLRRNLKPGEGARAGGSTGSTGLISTRTWVFIIYAAMLHLAVMLSYTKRHDLMTVCAEYHHEQATSFFPDPGAKHSLP